MPARAQERALKDIVVFVDSSGKGEDALRFAAGLATRHKARLLGIYVVGDPPSCHSFVRGSGAIRTMIETGAVREQREATSNGDRFLEIASQYNAKAAFRVVWNRSDAGCRIFLNSLLADMTVIGMEAPHGLPESWRPEKFLTLCGAPLLMVPAGRDCKVAPQRVAVAWNASKEARRAIADAMPFLIRANSVEVLAIDHDDDRPGIDLALHLARHGVRAKVRQIRSGDAPVGNIILSETSKSEADLIVMGAYSHAKTIRMVFGGVTQTILRLAEVPVLMSR